LLECVSLWITIKAGQIGNVGWSKCDRTAAGYE